jgi:hypothetical protein
MQRYRAISVLGKTTTVVAGGQTHGENEPKHGRSAGCTQAPTPSWKVPGADVNYALVGMIRHVGQSPSTPKHRLAFEAIDKSFVHSDHAAVAAQGGYKVSRSHCFANAMG